MDDPDHPPSKSRRTENDPTRSPARSFSDELAADEPAQPRASWTMQEVLPPKLQDARSRSPSDSASPDQLRMDTDGYWESGKHGRSPSRGPSMNVQREGDERDSYREDGYDDEFRDEDRMEDREGTQSDRSPTPVAPPPPPKPERLDYREKFVLRGHLRGVSAVRFSPDSSMIASAGADLAVKVWDTASGRLIHTFEGHLAGISTIAWSPDGATIASGSDDKTIRLWSVLTGKAHPVPFLGHHNYVYQIAFSPKGNILVSGSYDEAVFLWDVRSARVMKTLPAHSDPVGGIDVVWDGTLIASCASDGLIRIWDMDTGQCLRTLVHEDNPPVVAVKFSPNGKYVLAWSLDDCVRLWDYVAGRCLKTYQGHVNRKFSTVGGFGVYGLPGAPPEAFAVSGSEDGAVLCWDVVDKKILQRIEGHADVVLGVDACAFRGRRLLVSCGLDRTVRVWEEAGESGTVEPGPEGSPAGDAGQDQTGPDAQGQGNVGDTEMAEASEGTAPADEMVE